MAIDSARIGRYLKGGDYATLFREELGWDRYAARPLVVKAGERTWTLRGVAQKRGLAVLVAPPGPDGQLPDAATRRRIEREVARLVHEHLIVFEGGPDGEQIWQWARREPGGPTAYREQRYASGRQELALAEKLEALRFSLAEEEAGLGIVEVGGRVRAAFDVERVTKKFYDRFKAEHGVFLDFIAGIAAQGDREWYASLMLNRLMFVYFIQKKGFLDGNVNYLRDKLRAVQGRGGKGQFLSFYRYFLRRLFHDGLGNKARDAELERLLGNVPYLNGGLFEVHQLEEANPDIDIPDEAFERVFDFFDGYQWRLDERPLKDEREINPDVLGYIFEKYINQKQMGAYYTKEDITGYIGTNTILPFLLARAAADVAIAFEPDGAAWRLVRENPDRYIHDAVLRGVDGPVPAEIAAGEQDVAVRGGWNQPADPALALPTETWREFMARRARCRELRAKLAAGEVHAVDDLITLNLNLRQFAHDVIAYSEDPSLVRSLYRAIGAITVLDPTCGSGAFLFAALSILQPFYDACLDRMRGFVEDADAAAGRRGVATAPRLEDFRATLKEAADHPNRDYFVLKAIILNNLYGVDIMEEAVEICKLRLFLKLAAQVQPERDRPNYGLEPLPDIDFNIRAGNTLVGFATYDEVKRALRYGRSGQGRIDLFGDMPAIERRASEVQRCFATFRDAQTRLDLEPGLLADEKRKLRKHLAALGGELDRYLAAEYGVDTANGGALAQWRATHQPFHWFVEFHKIMTDGGFDAIIGNPPYVGYGKVRGQYTVRGYATEPCANLYAFVVERSLALLGPAGRFGMIVPIASVSTDGMRELQDLYAGKSQWHSHYAVRPGKLFVGVDMNLTITLLRGSGGEPPACPAAFSTGYRRWSSGECSDRPVLFDTLPYTDISKWRASPHANPYPKLGSALEGAILGRMLAHGRKLGEYQVPGGQTLYYHSGGRYWRKALPDKLSSHYKPLTVPPTLAPVAFALLNSQLFYWYWIGNSNCMDVVSREVLELPVFDLQAADSATFAGLQDRLLTSYYGSNTTRRRRGERIDVEEINFDVQRSKPIIDEIDRLLARHYGFTDEELDTILNYDIKYHVGRDGGAGG